MALPKQVSSVLRTGTSNKIVIAPAIEASGCPRGWRGALCRSRCGACRTACRTTQTAAIAACAAGGLSGPVAAACVAAAYAAGNECYNGCC